VVPWRRAGDGLEVYWLRRGRGLPFMAGWHAFPGGGVDRADAALPVAGAPWHPAPEEPTRPSPDWSADLDPDLAPGVAAAALRELFEEAGLLLLRDGRVADPERLRTELLARRASLSAALAAAGAALDAGRLAFAGRWLTPPFSPLRFDNRFFLAEWRPEDGEPSIAPPESDEGRWIAPADAFAELARGSALAAPPIVHLLRVLAEEGADPRSPRWRGTAEADLGPLRRIELRPGILLFPLAAATLPPASHTNAFVVGSGECVLVDPGSAQAAEIERLLAALAAAERELGRRVVEIWLTHHHPDHVGGAAELSRRLGVPIAAHAATAERVAARGIEVGRRLAPGEEVDLAGEPPLRLRVHHTPGHARGHLAIEVVGAGDLLGGDLVAGFGTIVIDPPEGDMDDYLESLERMRGRGFRTLFPSHGAPILDVDGKLEEYIAHRLARERQVLALWRRGLRAPADFLPEVYPDVPPPIRPLAERQVVAHLERLGRRGAL
jgi:glyoxylase-like metal-dependent hydrolase (beta-lactamase superfamily II)/8-oxo-dGTP pyrophosphatase MutT (NUDIX family)